MVKAIYRSIVGDWVQKTDSHQQFELDVIQALIHNLKKQEEMTVKKLKQKGRRNIKESTLRPLTWDQKEWISNSPVIGIILKGMPKLQVSGGRLKSKKLMRVAES